ncbi:MAG: tetratricopeptide repeat protein [Alphaproteobacteria bacterium]|nr:tetratricopeptide repeat protein [Alphaproteobacteria bacterium]
MTADAAERLDAEGFAYFNARTWTTARRCYRQAIALTPSLVAALGNLANLELQDERFRLAIAGYRRGLAIAPQLAGLHLMLGTALLREARFEDAEHSMAEAIRLNPGYPKAYYNLGIYKLERRRLVEAERDFRQALKGEPTSALALAGLARVLVGRGRSKEARTVGRRAIALSPPSLEALSALGHVFAACGDLTASIALFRRAVAIAANPFVVKDLMFHLHYDPAATSAEIFALHRRWAAAQQKPDPRYHSSTRDPDRRLRVGYLSADVYDHPVGHNIQGLIVRHDPGSIDTYVYADHDRSDPVVSRIRAACRAWRSTVGLDDRAVAERIRSDKIDILVVLAGHTFFNRIAVAALKPAPIQVSMYDFSTSGLDQVDYFVSDAIQSPEGGEEQFSEKVVRLPCLYLQVPLDEIPAPARAGDPVAFGSCSNPIKLNDRVIALWSRLLDTVPGSTLVLKYHGWFDDPSLVDEMKARFVRRGVAPSRLALHGRQTDRLSHLGLVGNFDIALDPFPFNGNTTTYEALWMGVPVVSMAGRRLVGRMSAAMLRQVGLDDLVATSEDDYVAVAARLARDAERRLRLRRELRARLTASRLLDASAYARSVESAYREMWRSWCGSRSSTLAQKSINDLS